MSEAVLARSTQSTTKKVAWSEAMKMVQAKIKDTTQQKVLQAMLSGTYPSGDIARKLGIPCREVERIKDAIWKMIDELVG